MAPVYKRFNKKRWWKIWLLNNPKNDLKPQKKPKKRAVGGWNPLKQGLKLISCPVMSLSEGSRRMKSIKTRIETALAWRFDVYHSCVGGWNPLKRGLKLRLNILLLSEKKCRRMKSIKTRIETRLTDRNGATVNSRRRMKSIKTRIETLYGHS